MPFPRHFRVAEASLNSVSAGLALANAVVDALRAGETVVLDLSAAERMTPSFANALAMTILDAAGEAVAASRLSVLSTSGPVNEAWSKSVERYRRGFRLSTQRPGAA